MNKLNWTMNQFDEHLVEENVKMKQFEQKVENLTKNQDKKYHVYMR
jgi:hypothetical protein